MIVLMDGFLLSELVIRDGCESTRRRTSALGVSFRPFPQPTPSSQSALHCTRTDRNGSLAPAWRTVHECTDGRGAWSRRRRDRIEHREGARGGARCTWRRSRTVIGAVKPEASARSFAYTINEIGNPERDRGAHVSARSTGTWGPCRRRRRGGMHCLRAICRQRQ